MEAPEVIVPVIDVSPLFGEDLSAKLAVSRQILSACQDSGFFFISNHGIEVLDEFVKITRDFHSRMTEEEKLEIAMVAYNSANVNQKRNGYYLPIPGKKAVESFVSNRIPLF